MATRAFSTGCGLVAALLALPATAGAARLDIEAIREVNYAVNHEVEPCRSAERGIPCTWDYAPALAGDCKQFAALKLQRLIQAGARPGDFSIWRTLTPLGPHAVVVENATGLVLDNLIGQVEPRALKERYEGMVFIGPCEPCGEGAEAAAMSARWPLWR